MDWLWPRAMAGHHTFPMRSPVDDTWMVFEPGSERYVIVSSAEYDVARARRDVMFNTRYGTI